MSKTKRLLACVLTVVMVLSMMTFSAFAAGGNVFAEDYVAPVSVDGSATPKNTAVIITNAAKNKAKGTDITVTWDDQDWIFKVGYNAFTMDQYDMAATQADVLADGGLPQLLLAAGTYQDLDIKSAIQVFGYHWNDNPNAVSADLTKTWGLNPEWNSNNTIVHDVTITAAAVGTIDIYGIQIAHRFYDCWRKISASKTVLTLRNVHLYQTDTTTAIKANDATGRVANMSKFAMTFWNPNSHNSTAATAQYNKDETHLVNFRLGKLNMVTGDNRFIDEKVSPVFVIDGFCADYAGNDKTQTFWMKWSDGFSRTRCEIKNSYFTKYGTAAKTGSFALEGFYSNKDTDTTAGELAELYIHNNIFYDNHTSTISQLRIYQTEYDKVSINNNYFVSSAGEGQFIEWSTVGGGDLSEAIEMKDNTFLGIPRVNLNLGNADTRIDMTGTHIQSEYSADYKSKTTSILPTGNVRYDYCYLDGARTVNTAHIQSFTIKDAVVDSDAKTVALAAEQGFYYKTPVVSGLVEWEIYESDAEFSNADDFSTSAQLERCVLKDTTNYFLFVVYSLDKSNYEVYKMTVTRPAPDVEGLAIDGFASDKDFVIDGATITAQLSKDDESVDFKPIVGEGVDYKLSTSAGSTVAKNDDGSYTVSGLVRGTAQSFRLELAKGADREYYTLVVLRPYNTACDIVSLGSNVVADGENYKTGIANGAKELTFDIAVSDDAWAYVKVGTSIYTDKNGKITVPGIKAGEYEFGVVAEDGVTAKVCKLKVEKIKNTEAKVVSVKGAKADKGGFVAEVVNMFEVDATVSAGATYKVYYDAECAEVVEDNIVLADDKPVTVYIVVTAEDGVTVSAPVALTVSKLNFTFEVEGAENIIGIHVVELDKDVKETTLKIKAENCKYQLYADPNLTTKASNKIKLDAATVNLYADVTYPDNSRGVEYIVVVSPRTPVKFADEKSIPTWAKAYLDKLNNEGYGLIFGDEKGNFNATNGMTRYEIAAIATRLIGVDASQFANVKLPYVDDIAPWAENYVKAVTQLGIMTGSKNAEGKLVFDGQGTTTRAQLAKIIVDVSFIVNGMEMSSTEYYKENAAEVDAAYNAFKFADDAEVANWAKPYVKLAVFAEYFVGSKSNGKNYINSNDNILRQEIVVVMSNFLGIE